MSPKEKLVGYIIKNPPEDKMSKAEKKWVLWGGGVLVCRVDVCMQRQCWWTAV